LSKYVSTDLEITDLNDTVSSAQVITSVERHGNITDNEVISTWKDDVRFEVRLG
jgi:hypothetical protein